MCSLVKYMVYLWDKWFNLNKYYTINIIPFLLLRNMCAFLQALGNFLWGICLEVELLNHRANPHLTVIKKCKIAFQDD